MSPYDKPEYYEIAFSFRDIPMEVDFLERAVRRFSGRPVERVLEIACGTCPHLEELARRGYRYAGLDRRASMLRFAARRVAQLGVPAELHRGDLRRFTLPRRRHDLAFVMLGSLYVRSNQEFLEHLDSVARTLRPGALYVIDGYVWFNILSDNRQSWTIQRHGVRVRAHYRAEVVDAVSQATCEVLTLNVDDHGRKLVLHSRTPTKCMFPAELLCVLERQRAFEFVGWFQNFDLAKRPRARGRQCVILRRR